MKTDRTTRLFEADLALAPREVQIVVQSVRTVVVEADAARLKALAGEGPDWKKVLDLAVYHRVLPLVCHALAEHTSDALPPDLLDFCRRRRFAVASQNVALVRELERLLVALSEQNIPALTFKGPLLASSVYDNIALRVSGDIDLLIRSEDVPRFHQVITADGYGRYADQLSEDDRSGKYRVEGQCAYVDDGRRWSIDAHVRLMPTGYSGVAPFQTLWEEGRDETVCGATVRTVAPEVMIVLLCLHGTKDRWQEMKHMCDVAAFVRANPDLDWQKVLRLAASISSERMLLLGMALAQQVVGAELPGAIRERLRSAGAVNRLAGPIMDNLLHERTEFLRPAERLRFFFAVHDTAAARLRYVWYVVQRRLHETSEA